MDEFIFVLLAGLIMIGILLVAWGIPPEEKGNVTGTITNPFSIGVLPKDVARQIPLGDFEVSYAVGSEVIESETNINIEKKEKLSMSGVIEQDFSLVTGGFLTIYIKETNQGGNLIVKVNDKEVFNQKVNVGKVEIPIGKDDLQDYNIVEVSVSSPGWKFWVKPFYNLDKVDFGINFYGNLKKIEEFQVYPEELRNFRTAEVSFDLKDSSGGGNLIIEVNNHMIYKGHPSLDFHSSFDQYDVGLIQGLNTISFSVESGSSYKIENAVLTIIREESTQKSKSFDFNVDSSWNDDLEGTVNFYISDTDYKGNLLLTITDSSGDKHTLQAIQSYSVGETKTVDFDESFVNPGENTLTFEATGGNFVISNVKIERR